MGGANIKPKKSGFSALGAQELFLLAPNCSPREANRRCLAPRHVLLSPRTGQQAAPSWLPLYTVGGGVLFTELESWGRCEQFFKGCRTDRVEDAARELAS